MPKRKRKHPNGYGTVFKVERNKIHPWIAKAPATFDSNGYPVQKTIGIFKTQKEALQALADYNKNPYNLDEKNVTLKDLFEIFMERMKSDKIRQGKDPNEKDSKYYVYTSAFNRIKVLHNRKIKEVKTYELQNVLDSLNYSHQSKEHTKALIKQLFDIACELDIVEKNYCSFVKLEQKEKSDIHKAFTKDEIKILENNLFKYPYMDTVIIMIYTGLRPSELRLIKKDDIDLKNRIMRGGLKTKAGRNRIIPISNKIYKLVEKRYNSSKEYLIEEKGKMLSPVQYRLRWNSMFENLNITQHLPHDCRHTFVTLANERGIDKTIIKKIIGHSNNDITDDVYNHTYIETMLNAVDVI